MVYCISRALYYSDIQSTLSPRMKEKVSLDFVPGEDFSIQGATEEERTLTTLDQVN